MSDRNSSLVRLDALMNLCAACGSFRPYWNSVAPERDFGGYGCRDCGCLAGNTPGQIAHLMRLSDPKKIRAQRLSWVAELRHADEEAEYEAHLVHQDNALNPYRSGRYRRYQEAVERRFAVTDTVREKFLASIGAVPVPVELYTLWIDTLEQTVEQRASLQDTDYARTGHASVQRYSDLSSVDLWMPTLPFRFEEIPPLYGANSISLLLLPALTADYLPVPQQWSQRALGHNQVYALVRTGTRLSAWRSDEDRHVLHTYRDVETLRQDRQMMRRIRRQWCTGPIDRILAAVA